MASNCGKWLNTGQTRLLTIDSDGEELDKDVSTSSLDAGDIIIYNLKFVGNGPCRIVTAVNVDLTRHEPQPPKKKGDRLIFLRAPILFVDKLTCDLDEL